MTEIEFVGYSAVHPSDFIYDVPNGFTGYLLLLFDSPSELLIDGRLIRTAANSAILYTPGSRIYYRAAGEEYRNDAGRGGWQSFSAAPPALCCC